MTAENIIVPKFSSTFIAERRFLDPFPRVLTSILDRQTAAKAETSDTMSPTVSEYASAKTFHIALFIT